MNIPEGYKVIKSNGRGGWEFHCSKGFKFFNYFSEEQAIIAANEHHNMKASKS